MNCPTVSDKLANVAIPASAQAEVTRNLALLNTQINEANNRLRTSVGQGGPNFIQNAILGPLADKRVATVNRIATAIGRQGTKPEGLAAFATCTLNTGGGASTTEPASIPAGNANGAGGGGAAAAAPVAAVRTINCPAVNVSNVPAAAQAEVDRNLALLNTQISEANNRLATSVGQGGPNFVQNAILGPLSSKRAATLDRIRIAFNRQGATPPSLSGLDTCTASGG